MRVSLCWSHISGYMAACCRELAARDGIDLSIIAFKSDSPGSEISFGDELLRGLKFRTLNAAEQTDAALVRSLVLEHKPDVVVIPGWFHKPYVALAHDSALRDAKIIMTMDTPWRGTLRQRLGKFAIASLLTRIDGVIVA